MMSEKTYLRMKSSKPSHFKKFDANVKKRDYQNLCEEVLKIYKVIIDARMKKIMELL